MEFCITNNMYGNILRIVISIPKNAKRNDWNIKGIALCEKQCVMQIAINSETLFPTQLLSSWQTNEATFSTDV
ncbi:hypothetical protein METHB2_390028 [Candidatus Methylobacter favarea]|uniref:Uncharacterized protein n=1 Tax=Candidatus Methylobacter favarea TaxID=2707345 RepID=A0A8S0WJG0_9GAMM|nr:hypothetical protein METHB2_390028 [Candidatus Methylobacter favarea]